jgi:hypothetical protein
MTDFISNQDIITTIAVMLNDVFGMKPLNSPSPNTSALICKIPMKTKLISKQNCIPLQLSPAQTGGCPGNMRLTMTLIQMYHNK